MGDLVTPRFKWPSFVFLPRANHTGITTFSLQVLNMSPTTLDFPTGDKNYKRELKQKRFWATLINPGSEPFSPLSCHAASKFEVLSVFSLVETICRDVQGFPTKRGFHSAGDNHSVDHRQNRALTEWIPKSQTSVPRVLWILTERTGMKFKIILIGSISQVQFLQCKWFLLSIYFSFFFILFLRFGSFYKGHYSVWQHHYHMSTPKYFLPADKRWRKWRESPT